MRLLRRTAMTAALVFALCSLTRPTWAATSINVSGTFVENMSKEAGCTADVCGSGILLPLGKATETLVSSVPGCPGCAPNIKTFTFADGTLITQEQFVGGSCANPYVADHGNCGVFSGETDSTILGGTGAYAGATGSLVDHFTIAGHSAIAHYTGTVILP